MRALIFATRNTKEILRDPINFFFGLGFPVVLILLLSAIQANVPVSLFEIDRLTPGITVLGLSFMTLFSATLIAKDRGSAFFARLYTTPMRAADFIIGYTLPIIPLALLQSAICYVLALVLGLKFTLNIFVALVFIIPIAIFFVSLGLLCGSVFTQNQVGGLCGALLTNLTAWTAGIWFDLELVGGAFKSVAECLPFYHAVRLEQAALDGNLDGAWLSLLIVSIYAAITLIAAIMLFLKQMKR